MSRLTNMLALALRNLLRNRRRSTTTLLAMIVGAVAVLLFGGYSRDINYALQTGFVQGSGHLQIQHKDYFLFGSGNPAAYGIADYAKIVELVRHDPVLAPMLEVVTPTLTVGGLAGNFEAGVSRTVFGRGVQVDDQNRMRRWNDFGLRATPRQLALTQTSDDAAVIGVGVARVLQLCEALAVSNCPTANAAIASNQVAAKAADGTADAPAADAPAADAPPDIADLVTQERSANATSAVDKPEATSGTNGTNGTNEPNKANDSTGTGSAGAPPRIEMLAANAKGAPNVAALKIVKAELQGVKELDDMFVMLHLAQAQRLVYGSRSPQVTAIAIQLKHSSQMPAARARLQGLLKSTLRDYPLEIQDFATLNPSYGQITGMFGAIFGFISLLIGAIVLFTVGNTMSMAVVERTIEIGTLRAVGLRRGGIRRLFVTEGLLLGMIGAVAGVTIALGAAWLINHAGLTWLPPSQVEPVPLTVRVWGETQMIASCAVGLVIVAVISAWWPARRAASLNIVDALRHV